MNNIIDYSKLPAMQVNLNGLQDYATNYIQVHLKSY